MKRIADRGIQNRVRRTHRVCRTGDGKGESADMISHLTNNKRVKMVCEEEYSNKINKKIV